MGLAQGFRDFLSLAEAESYVPVTIANDHQGAEAEADDPPFHDFGNPVQGDDLLDETQFILFHDSAILSGLELEAAFAGAIGHGLDLAVVEISVTVEDHLFDALLLGQTGNFLTYRFSAQPCCN